MRKYERGTLLRDIIQQEVKETEEILEKNKMPEEDRNVILSALKNMAFRLCYSRASASAMEEAVRKMHPDLDEAELFRRILLDGVREEKIKEMYPFPVEQAQEDEEGREECAGRKCGV